MALRTYIDAVRVLAALGAVCFAYLAVIPAAVVGATIDPACSGQSCSYSQPVTVYLVIAFGATALALVFSGLAMALFAARPSTRNARLIRGSLKVSAVLIGVVLLSEVALPDPVAAIVIVGICVPVALIGTARRAGPVRPPGAGTRRAPG
jgi:hypothetical protein